MRLLELGCSALLSILFASESYAQFTTRVSVDSNGNQATGSSSFPSVSSDGRFVAFHSYAFDLVPGDNNGTADVFVHDRQTNQTSIVSISPSGSFGDNPSSEASISADGRFVAFWSFASNFVPQTYLGYGRIIVHDRVGGSNELASIDSNGVQANDHSYSARLSGDARWVVFVSRGNNLVPNDANAVEDVFLHDRVSATTICVSVDATGTPGAGASDFGVPSADGQYVAFQSRADNLVPGDSNGASDVFVRDVAAGTTLRVSVDAFGGPTTGDSNTPRISSNGRRVAFLSSDPGLVAGDTNGALDAFVRDLDTGVTQRVDISTGGIEADLGADAPSGLSISGDGHFVAFCSLSGTLVPSDTNMLIDVFVHDTSSGTTARLDLGNSAQQSHGSDSYFPSLDAIGHVVAYTSAATNLVPGDFNQLPDVFVSVWQFPIVEYCTAKINSQVCQSFITSSGSPNVVDPTPFTIAADQVINHKSGLLFYGSHPASIPFQGSYLCVQPPLVRTGVQSSGGSAPPVKDCSGTLSFDFNALIQSGQDPSLSEFITVYAQFWYRDPDDSYGFGTGLSDALQFTIVP